MKDSMNVIDTRLPELLRGSRPLLGMFVGMPVPGLDHECCWIERWPKLLEELQSLVTSKFIFR
jgi:hypothetical protein